MVGSKGQLREIISLLQHQHPPNLVVALESAMNVKRMSLNNKYLVLPLFVGRAKKRAFEDVKAKVLSKVASWKVRALSQAGRTTLIKSIAAAMLLYCMSTCLLPKGRCEEIDKILKDFWWGFSPLKSRNFTTKAWDAICLPKSMGGLGIRKMHEVNTALIAKLGWKIFSNPESLWVQLARFKYRFSHPISILPVNGGES